GVACTPDGRYVALGTKEGIQLWNVDPAKKAVRQFGLRSARAPAFSRDGRLLAATGSVNNNQTVWVWEAASGRVPGYTGKGVRVMPFPPAGSNSASGLMKSRSDFGWWPP